MKKTITLCFLLLTQSLLSNSAIAQEDKTPLVPLPSVDDFTKGENGWAFGLGLGVEYEAAYEGSDEYGFEVDPAGAVQWRSGDNIFYWAGEALGWRGLRDNRWLVDVAIGFDEGREESDSDDGHLDGLGDGEEGMELVMQLRHTFDDNWRYWVDGRIVVTENGNLGLLGMGKRFGEKNDGSGHEIALAVVYHDSDYANKDFGIDADQAAASGLPETNLSGGFRSVGLNYNYRHYLNDNWQIFGEAVYEQYLGDIKDSPIARNDYEAEIGLGVIYVF
ncbi:MipA/OmpV family protein [Thalassotalea sp. LPB0316]|uniref:MipA/OmpV family protein n=1 Tax=Thalassotalea sp. LPB0316 TaxID=2769490 RepID=UPI001865E629|nr:MipA/OmpV family protein [Thalassotalea sp. LPB0316]QOL24591.1 MipA/OmpV family protein [Thalassotalea sp. LPB0316]